MLGDGGSVGGGGGVDGVVMTGGGDASSVMVSMGLIVEGDAVIKVAIWDEATRGCRWRGC